MKKIGVTGSLASGKTTASKFLSNNKGPLFSSDKIVKKLYTKKNFKKNISKKFGIKNNSNIRFFFKKKNINKYKLYKKTRKNYSSSCKKRNVKIY